MASTQIHPKVTFSTQNSYIWQFQKGIKVYLDLKCTRSMGNGSRITLNSPHYFPPYSHPLASTQFQPKVTFPTQNSYIWLFQKGIRFYLGLKGTRSMGNGWRITLNSPYYSPPTPTFTPWLPPYSTQKWLFLPKIAIFDYFKKESGSILA